MLEMEKMSSFEEVKLKTHHRITNFIIDWLQTAANQSKSDETKKRLRSRVDFMRLMNPDNPKIRLQNWQANNPEEAKVMVQGQ